MTVEIKGQNNGLVIVFGPGTFQENFEVLQAKLDSNPQLFTGFPVTFRGDNLQSLPGENMASLQRLCLDYGMTIALPAPNRSTKEQSQDLIVKRTLRSGQKIIHNGSVVIVGDVHESAEVVAAGDVLVMGRLEGVVHAGCMGELSSVVVAFRLNPRQVRIGDLISRPPSNADPNSFPEMAYVEDNRICVKEYLIPRSNSKRASI